jgi:hypothetical protein
MMPTYEYEGPVVQVVAGMLLDGCTDLDAITAAVDTEAERVTADPA